MTVTFGIIVTPENMDAIGLPSGLHVIQIDDGLRCVVVLDFNDPLIMGNACPEPTDDGIEVTLSWLGVIERYTIPGRCVDSVGLLGQMGPDKKEEPAPRKGLRLVRD